MNVPSTPNDSKRQLLRHASATLAYAAAKPFVARRAESLNFMRRKLHGLPDKTWLIWATCWTGHLTSPRAKRTGTIHSRRSRGIGRTTFLRGLAGFRSLPGLCPSAGGFGQEAFPRPCGGCAYARWTDRHAPPGSPIQGENYFRADIAAGRVGIEQAPPLVID